MSSVIPELLPTCAFEFVRDRIGAILVDEFAAQAALMPPGPDQDLILKFQIYVERFIRVDKEENIVNVVMARGDYDGRISVQENGTYTFFLDVFTSAKTTAAIGGDSRAMLRLQKVLGLCWNILMHSRYKTLGFEMPFIASRAAVSMEIKQPDTQNSDADNLVMGRLTMSVKVRENSGTVLPRVAQGFDTSAKLDLTDKGYLYIRNA